MLAFQPAASVDLTTLHGFLQGAAGTCESEPYRTAYRKLVCRYDQLRYGF